MLQLRFGAAKFKINKQILPSDILIDKDPMSDSYQEALPGF